KQRIAGAPFDMAIDIGRDGGFASLREQCLEVRHADLVVATHRRDGADDALACELMTCCLDLLRAAAHQALGATQVRVHIDIEQLDKELMQIRMDEARLREESLGRGLVVGLSVRGEVRRMTDAPPIAMAAARMHSE